VTDHGPGDVAPVEVVLGLIEDERLAALRAEQQAEQDRPLLAGGEVIEGLRLHRALGLHLDPRAVFEPHGLQAEDLRPVPYRAERLLAERPARLLVLPLGELGRVRDQLFRELLRGDHLSDPRHMRLRTAPKGPSGLITVCPAPCGDPSAWEATVAQVETIVCRTREK
jgi:hypothetical protein